MDHLNLVNNRIISGVNKLKKIMHWIALNQKIKVTRRDQKLKIVKKRKRKAKSFNSKQDIKYADSM